MTVNQFSEKLFSRITAACRLPALKVFLVLMLLAAVAWISYSAGLRQTAEKISPSKNIHVAFLMEVYDKIKENYWEKIDNKQLIDMFILGAEKLTGQQLDTKVNNRENLQQKLIRVVDGLDSPEKKKEFSATLADAVLASLKPFGRSRLYTQKLESELKNNISNINPDVNRYEALGVDKEASAGQLKKAYEEKSAFWNPETNKSPEAEEKYKAIQQAYKVLSDEENRQLYDISGAEPTMDYKFVRPEIFYIHIKKFSPQTVEELQRVGQKAGSRNEVNTLILDLRDNVGGLIDGLPYFLGPFIGLDQYAYQFFHQGEKTDFKTKTGWLDSLVPFKQTVVLINEGTQSSAEVMAATLKKYNVGVVVGTPSKGWGTVEKVFPLTTQFDDKEKYSIFLVHSLTLADDGQPIEERGVQPAVNIKDANWEKNLYAYFRNNDLIAAVKEVWNMQTN